MSNSIVADQPQRTRRRLNNQQIAWIILLSAFAIFCVICIITLYGINYFLFQSTVPMNALLGVGRGTAGYVGSDPIERVVREQRRYMSINEQVSVDTLSQATIFFQDPYQDAKLIAAVTMRGGTAGGASLNFGYALRPRFEWSSVGYRIDLRDVEGGFDVFVPPDLGRDFWLTVQTRQGALIYILGSGSYTIDATDEQVQVYNREGLVVLISADLKYTNNINAGQRGIAYARDQGSKIGLLSGFTNLLKNSAFQGITAEASATLTDSLLPWQCGDIESTPKGNIGIGAPDGISALRLWRGQDANSHGETFCSQPLGQGQIGLDVSGLDFLALKATMYIDQHSLSACGIQGSECPLMLQIDYIYRDEVGKEQPAQWFHGFYSQFDPTTTYPPRCSSCTLDHENVYGKAWYTYDSGNLFAILPPNQRPVSILRVRFYASGHQYNVYVRDVALLGGNIQITDPNSAPTMQQG